MAGPGRGAGPGTVGAIAAPPSILDLIAGNGAPSSAVAWEEPHLGTALTYGELGPAVERAAAALRGLGVGPGDRVAVQAPGSGAFLTLYLGVLRAGAVFLPMNTAYTDDEVAFLVHDAEPALVLRDLEGTWAAALAAADPSGAPGLDLAPDQPAALLYTSGTTGRPKGAVLTHGGLAANAAALIDAWGVRGDDVLLHVLPMYHAHGLFVAVHCALGAGARMVVLGRFDAAEVVRRLPGATVFMGVPTHYARLLAEPDFDRQATDGVRLFVSGSAPLPATTHEAVEARTGHRVLERYGMTETVMLTSNPLTGERRPGSVGRPLPGVRLRITGQDGTPLPSGEVGMIEVAGPSVSPGYWARPELLRTDRTADGWFRTGDLGVLDADGYLRIVGREKDLVISGGLNVYPAEVEAALDRVPGVAESAVVGAPDPDLGERVVAVVAPHDGAALDPDEVRRAVRGSLAGFKVPKEVVVVDALPRNAMGKVDKKALRARVAHATDEGS